MQGRQFGDGVAVARRDSPVVTVEPRTRLVGATSHFAAFFLSRVVPLLPAEPGVFLLLAVPTPFGGPV